MPACMATAASRRARGAPAGRGPPGLAFSRRRGRRRRGRGRRRCGADGGQLAPLLAGLLLPALAIVLLQRERGAERAHIGRCSVKLRPMGACCVQNAEAPVPAHHCLGVATGVQHQREHKRGPAIVLLGLLGHQMASQGVCVSVCVCACASVYALDHSYTQALAKANQARLKTGGGQGRATATRPGRSNLPLNSSLQHTRAVWGRHATVDVMFGVRAHTHRPTRAHAHTRARIHPRPRTYKSIHAQTHPSNTHISARTQGPPCRTCVGSGAHPCCC